MTTADAVRTAVRISMPTIASNLTGLVITLSVSAFNHDQSEVQRPVEAVATLLRDNDLDVKVLSVPTPDDTPGRPAVLAHKAGPQDSPHAPLYSHHDAQPVGDPTGWDQADPFTAERCEEWLFGHGTADNKTDVIAHAHTLRILVSLADGELPYSVTVFIEGKEEVGSLSFENFLATRRDCLVSDVIVVADSSNWKVGTPSLATPLCGVIQVDVHLDMLDRAPHSGMYGSLVLDAATTMCRLITSCHNDTSDVAMAGLVSRFQANADFPDHPEADFRANAGILDSVGLSGIGDLTTRLWTKPSLTLVGINVTPLELADNVPASPYTARLSLRITPGQDPAVIQEALVTHPEKRVPFEDRLTVTGREAGPASDGSEVIPASEATHWALSTAWDTEAVNIGQGGSIPSIATLKETFSGAQILVAGIEDPDTRVHSENESMHLDEPGRIVVAEALPLARLSGATGS